MRRITWVVAAALLGGCLSTETTDPTKLSSAAVMGQVVKPDGITGVSGPVVSIQLLTKPVNNTAQLISQSAVTADANGRFLFIFLLNGIDPQDAIANLAVTAPIGSGFLNADTVAIPVKIIRGQSPSDTSFVQFTLKPR